MLLYSTSLLRQSACAFILLTCLYIVLTDSMVSADAPICDLGVPEWSNTDPPVDQGHIFCGGINSKGKATGYHHREGGTDVSSARIRSIAEINTKTGVYVSKTVSVFDGKNWVDKKNISSFFPDSCSGSQVIKSISYAASHIECRYLNGRWSGKSAPIAQSMEDYCLGNDEEPLLLNGYWRTPNAQKVATAWPLIDGKNKGGCK